jgi:hypothetical protein
LLQERLYLGDEVFKIIMMEDEEVDYDTTTWIAGAVSVIDRMQA